MFNCFFGRATTFLARTNNFTYCYFSINNLYIFVSRPTGIALNSLKNDNGAKGEFYRLIPYARSAL